MCRRILDRTSCNGSPKLPTALPTAGVRKPAGEEGPEAETLVRCGGDELERSGERDGDRTGGDEERDLPFVLQSERPTRSSRIRGAVIVFLFSLFPSPVLQLREAILRVVCRSPRFSGAAVGSLPLLRPLRRWMRGGTTDLVTGL